MILSPMSLSQLLKFFALGYAQCQTVGTVKSSRLFMTASKAGVIGFVDSLKDELKDGITVNAVAPGMVMTEMAENIPAEFLNAAVNETVLGRIASSEDVANVVVFLCSDLSRHITGEVIKVDGGQYI